MGCEWNSSCYLLLIPSGPQKCFHFSEINNSVTYISKIMRLSYFNTYMIKFPLLIVFFQNRYRILRAIEQEARAIFFLPRARLSVDN